MNANISVVAQQTGNSAAKLEELRDLAINRASEAPLTSAGDFSEAFSRLVRAELVLLEKATNGEFVSPVELEVALDRLMASRPVPRAVQPSPDVVVIPESGDAAATSWWEFHWLRRRNSLKTVVPPAPPPDPEAEWNMRVNDLRKQLERTRLRELEHRTFVTERLDVVRAEFDVQLHRATAAIRVAVDSEAPEHVGENLPQEAISEKETEHESRTSFVQ